MQNSFVPETSELVRQSFGTYKTMYWKTFYNAKNNPTILQIKTSLHKMHNNFEHNHNFFSYPALVNTIDELSLWFGIEPSKMQIMKLEFGLNVILDKQNIESNQLLDNLIINNRMPFGSGYEGHFKYKQTEHSQRILKVYQKGKQHQLAVDILRIEVKYLARSFLKKNKIISVADLSNMSKLQSLMNNLLFVWSKTIMFEPRAGNLKSSNVPETQILRWQNLNYWNEVKRGYRNKYSREVKRFRKYVAEETANHFELITHELKNVWNRFLPSYEDKKVQISTLYIDEKCTTINKERFCKITGIDISHQKPESQFISTKTVLAIFDRDEETFKTLFNQYVKTNDRNYLALHEICEKIAHNVRNKYWNREYRLEYLPYKYKNSLFPVMQDRIVS